MIKKKVKNYAKTALGLGVTASVLSAIPGGSAAMPIVNTGVGMTSMAFTADMGMSTINMFDKKMKSYKKKKGKKK